MSTLQTTILKHPDSGTNNIQFDSSGRVGVGTSASQKLHSKTSNEAALLLQREGSSSDAFGSAVFFGNDHSTNGTYIFGIGDGTMRFGQISDITSTNPIGSGNEVMRFTSIRDFTFNRTGGITFSTNITDGIVFKRNPNRLDISSESVARITQIRDATGLFDRFYRAGSVVGGISTDGTNTSFNTSSDYRLKENVVDITDGITRVKQLQPRRFNFIANPNKIVDGFVAHETQVVVPESVTGTKDEVDHDGNAVMQGIDQSKLVPLLTAALQEAIAKIESLETKVAALEAG